MLLAAVAKGAGECIASGTMLWGGIEGQNQQHFEGREGLPVPQKASGREGGVCVRVRERKPGCLQAPGGLARCGLAQPVGQGANGVAKPHLGGGSNFPRPVQEGAWIQPSNGTSLSEFILDATLHSLFRHLALQLAREEESRAAAAGRLGPGKGLGLAVEPQSLSYFFP